MKGTNEVKIRQASTGHKHFTFTPVISADGTVAFQHVLLSKLKNLPSIGSSNVIVDGQIHAPLTAQTQPPAGPIVPIRKTMAYNSTSSRVKQLSKQQSNDIQI